MAPLLSRQQLDEVVARRRRVVNRVMASRVDLQPEQAERLVDAAVGMLNELFNYDRAAKEHADDDIVIFAALAIGQDI